MKTWMTHRKCVQTTRGFLNSRKGEKMKKDQRFLLLLFLCWGLFSACGQGGSSGDGGDDALEVDDQTDDNSADDDISADDTAADDTSDDDTAYPETWTDPSSDLTWQVTPQSHYVIWEDAKTYCDDLPLAGGSWHLPTLSELRTLIRGCEATMTGGSCQAMDSCLDYECQDPSCYSCEESAGPLNGCYGPPEMPGECDWYWSSSPQTDSPDYAWCVGFDCGGVYTSLINDDGNAVRCVR
jgi:hypothetical protein